MRDQTGTLFAWYLLHEVACGAFEKQDALQFAVIIIKLCIYLYHRLDLRHNLSIKHTSWLLTELFAAALRIL